ncbi:MAG: acyltransferase [Elainellaceae cyanobacterium]
MIEPLIPSPNPLSAQRQGTSITHPSRIRELDALRGLAALGVVFYHYTTRYGEIYGHTEGLPFSVPAGRYGVLLFFMISGFVILMSLERTQTALDFLIKRLTRLYPTYWAAIAVTFIAVAAFGLPGREVTGRIALLNGLMFHPLFNLPDVDGVYWTLLVELIFYGIMAGLFVMRAMPHIEWVMALWLGVNALETHNILIEVPAMAERWLILEYAHFFIMGIIFYRIRQHGESGLRYGILAACLASHIAIAPEPDKLIAVLLFMAAFFLINAGWLRAIAVPPLLALGTVSYPLYLIHQNIGYIVIRALESWGVSPALSIIAATTVAIALAIPIVYGVEQPVVRWVKAMYR